MAINIFFRTFSFSFFSHSTNADGIAIMRMRMIMGESDKFHIHIHLITIVAKHLFFLASHEKFNSFIVTHCGLLWPIVTQRTTISLTVNRCEKSIRIIHSNTCNNVEGSSVLSWTVFHHFSHTIEIPLNRCFYFFISFP